MDFNSQLARARRALMTRLVLKLSVVGFVVGWFMFPEAKLWKDVQHGLGVAGGFVRTATIRALGGDPDAQRKAADTTLDRLKSVNGFPASEVRCLAVAIYFEAGREPREAQIGVGQIAMNRAKTAKTPRQLCSVVYNGLKVPNGCLFEATCRNLGTAPAPGEALDNAIEVARALAAGTTTMPVFAQATHFHEKRARPGWSRNLFKIASHGRIEFYADEQPVDVSSGAVAPGQARAAEIVDGPRQQAAPRKSSRNAETSATKSSGQSRGDGGALARQVFGVD